MAEGRVGSGRYRRKESWLVEIGGKKQTDSRQEEEKKTG